jgi:hypothetical protein
VTQKSPGAGQSVWSKQPRNGSLAHDWSSSAGQKPSSPNAALRLVDERRRGVVGSMRSGRVADPVAALQKHFWSVAPKSVQFGLAADSVRTLVPVVRSHASGNVATKFSGFGTQSRLVSPKLNEDALTSHLSPSCAPPMQVPSG